MGQGVGSQLHRGRRLRGVALLAFVTFVPALNSPYCAAKDAKSDQTSVTLPERPAEIAPFMAKMDDQQARATLARVLQERTRDPEPERGQEMLMGVEHASNMLGNRLGQIAGAKVELATAPGVYWAWLTENGSDATAPWRALGWAAILILLGWLAQAGAGAAAFRLLRQWRSAGPLARRRVAAAVMPLRWMAFLGVAGAAHGLLPEVTRASRLTALAIVVTFAAAWISSRIIAVVLPGLVAGDRPATSWGLRPGVLDIALGIFFAGVFGLALLREAGISTDARLIGATLVWTLFGGLFLFAFGRARHPAADASASSDASRSPSFLNRHGMALLRLSFVAILIATPPVAMIRGPSAFWSGIASFGLLAVLVASLGLTRTERRADQQSASASPWGSTLRRGLQILVGVGLTLALSFVWDIGLFQRASTQLGDRVVQALVTVGITLVLTYLVWEVIRTALAQSALGPPTAEIERGEEGGGTAATRLQTFGPVLRNFLLVAVLTVATMVCLSALGMDIGPLLAGAGVIGLALGFGAQTLVRDIISGVFYLAEDAFRIGEYISIGNTRGTVEGIAIRSLKLRHHRGPIHTVPFGEIKQLTNYSRDWIIMKLEFLLAFDTDLNKVKKIVKAIGKELEAHPELGHAILEPIKSQGVRRMEPTGMVVGLKFMATPGSEVYMLRREVYQRVRDAFEENGIQFARPQVMIAAPVDAPLSAAARDQLAAAAIGIGAAHGPTGPRLVPQP
jgi:small-conductance mechanosensitive channel